MYAFNKYVLKVLQNEDSLKLELYYLFKMLPTI